MSPVTIDQSLDTYSKYRIISYYGFVGSLFVFFFIIGVDGLSEVVAFGFFGGNPICLRISSGEGIPGVGVTPGFTFFLSSASLGIPGVGVAPLGRLAITAGIPGVDAFDG